VIDGEPKVEMQSNLELWFTPHGTNGSRPAAPTHTHTHTHTHYKMAIVTTGGISFPSCLSP
jgi:hypothetical protein